MVINAGERGDFTRFSAMRYKDNTDEAERFEWVMRVIDYEVFEGIKVPAIMTATWRLDDGDWTWLKLNITDIAYNENASLQLMK